MKTPAGSSGWCESVLLANDPTTPEMFVPFRPGTRRVPGRKGTKGKFGLLFSLIRLIHQPDGPARGPEDTRNQDTDFRQDSAARNWSTTNVQNSRCFRRLDLPC